jgi:hypothetical protein
MEDGQNSQASRRIRSVLTDFQFWVPVTVLLGGLLLLHSLH